MELLCKLLLAFKAVQHAKEAFYYWHQIWSGNLIHDVLQQTKNSFYSNLPEFVRKCYCLIYVGWYPQRSKISSKVWLSRSHLWSHVQVCILFFSQTLHLIIPVTTIWTVLLYFIIKRINVCAFPLYFIEFLLTFSSTRTFIRMQPLACPPIFPAK